MMLCISDENNIALYLRHKIVNCFAFCSRHPRNYIYIRIIQVGSSSSIRSLSFSCFSLYFSSQSKSHHLNTVLRAAESVNILEISVHFRRRNISYLININNISLVRTSSHCTYMFDNGRSDK